MTPSSPPRAPALWVSCPFPSRRNFDVQPSSAKGVHRWYSRLRHPTGEDGEGWWGSPKVGGTSRWIRPESPSVRRPGCCTSGSDPKEVLTVDLNPLPLCKVGLDPIVTQPIYRGLIHTPYRLHVLTHRLLRRLSRGLSRKRKGVTRRKGLTIKSTTLSQGLSRPGPRTWTRSGRDRWGRAEVREDISRLVKSRRVTPHTPCPPWYLK